MGIEDAESVADQMEGSREDYETLGSSLFCGPSIAPLVVAGPTELEDPLAVEEEVLAFVGGDHHLFLQSVGVVSSLFTLLNV